MILENATVRASAVSALAKFGLLCPFLLPHILQLLRRCLYDNDDEVRDRAAFCLSSLKKESVGDIPNYEAGKSILYSVASLEKALYNYLDASHELAFDVSAIELNEHSPVAFGYETPAQVKQNHIGTPPTVEEEILDSQELVMNMSEFVQFGPIFKVCG